MMSRTLASVDLPYSSPCCERTGRGSLKFPQKAHCEIWYPHRFEPFVEPIDYLKGFSPSWSLIIGRVFSPSWSMTLQRTEPSMWTFVKSYSSKGVFPSWNLIPWRFSPFVEFYSMKLVNLLCSKASWSGPFECLGFSTCCWSTGIWCCSACTTYMVAWGGGCFEFFILLLPILKFLLWISLLLLLLNSSLVLEP